MLINLHVKNLAIIDEVEIDFSEHMNVLTGETGAGKSIILGSINLALGGKFASQMIRSGAEYALVELLFSVDSQEEKDALGQWGIIPENDMVLITRKLMPKRNVSRVNGETVTQAALKQIAGVLIDIHGQNEQQSLLHAAKHMEILDRYSREKLFPLQEEYGKIYQEYQKIQRSLAEKEISEEERLREISFMEYELEEIETVAMKEGEEELLEEEYQFLSHGTAIGEGLGEVHRLIASGNVSVSEQIGEARRILGKIVSYDVAMEQYAEQLSDIESLIMDFNRDISSYMDEFVANPERQEEVEKRLDQIRNMQAKYGNGIEAVQAYEMQIRAKLEKYRQYAAHRQQLRQEEAKAEKCLKELGQKMSKLRKKYALELEKKIQEALVELNFLQVEFSIVIRPTKQFTPKGIDEVEFMLSANPGEPMRSIGQAASGGELSRIMLAVKAVLAEQDAIRTLIFDEIDVGISGRTAQKVAEKMALIGKNHQVICISHLAQIAAMADTHYLIQKNNVGDRTVTTIEPLDVSHSIEELARILGGAKITDGIKESAAEMKELAAKQRDTIRQNG